jgi:AbrB family looped-hinge helix DNA binding protein
MLESQKFLLNYSPMAQQEQFVKIGKKGVLVIPAKLRELFGLKEGAFVITEATEGGILIRPAVTLPVEVYSATRQAEFLLSNAVDAEDYQKAREEVVAMGLNPDEIPHESPAL